MLGNRMHPDNGQWVVTEEVAVGAFVAVPLSAVGSFQEQLYHWAYEQAKQATQVSRPSAVPDLFAILN
jgi:hypothetical protein